MALVGGRQEFDEVPNDVLSLDFAGVHDSVPWGGWKTASGRSWGTRKDSIRAEEPLWVRFPTSTHKGSRLAAFPSSGAVRRYRAPVNIYSRIYSRELEDFRKSYRRLGRVSALTAMRPGPRRGPWITSGAGQPRQTSGSSGLGCKRPWPSNLDEAVNKRARSTRETGEFGRKFPGDRLEHVQPAALINGLQSRRERPPIPK
jgi:hypothetical protein